MRSNFKPKNHLKKQKKQQDLNFVLVKDGQIIQISYTTNLKVKEKRAIDKNVGKRQNFELNICSQDDLAKNRVEKYESHAVKKYLFFYGVDSFEKAQGNIYTQLDPPQIKFNGYEVNKVNTLTFKIINKAPIPQRFNILPPTQPHFSIKVNKKGSIPSGMYETVQVQFKATDYKYLYDVVKINTETENFIVPLYAYPTIPNLKTIFPKLIDFGNIELKQNESFFYPIKNPTPIDFKFDFLYKKQCAEIMINPLSGTIQGNGETVVEISFIPGRKMTYSAQVYFKMQQFDFEPIYIQIIGSGKQKQMAKTFKRLKSSKLVPLKQKQDDLSKSPQVQRMNQTETFLNDKIKDQKKSFVTNVRKVSSKISYPKLLNSTMKEKTSKPFESTVQAVNQKLNSSAINANSEERQFLHRYNRVQEVDKEKDIKFTEYLGDRTMTEEQLQVERSITAEMKAFRSNLLKTQCQSRNNPEKLQSPEVEYKVVKPSEVTWDENKNDSIYERRAILNKFVIAASKIIEVKRIKKRFEKVKQFLSDCSTKQEVAKKVEISYQKSLDSHSLHAFKGEIELNFSRDSLRPTYFELQFSQGKEKFNERIFKTEGKPEFDDLTIIPLIEEYESQKMNYGQVAFPPDFLYLDKQIPPKRVSGEEQFSVKSSSLPVTEPAELFNIVGRPFDIPNHFFIHQKDNVPLFKEYSAIDEKDPEFVFSIDEPIEDEFEGWSKGEFEVLKTKLLKNTGVSYTLNSSYNYSSARNDIGFLGDLTQNLPQFIEKSAIDDQLSDDDSDDEKYEAQKVQQVDEFLEKIEVNPEVKARRQKKQIENENLKNSQKIERNLQKDKFKKVTKYIEKVKDFNKMAERSENLLII